MLYGMKMARHVEHETEKQQNDFGKFERKTLNVRDENQAIS